MKTPTFMNSMLTRYCMCTVLLIASFHITRAQAVAQEKSARAAAISDHQFIIANIGDNKDAMFLIRNATERAFDNRTKELAQLMSDNHTTILYEFEQLEVAGAGASTTAAPQARSSKEVSDIYAKLSRTPREDFDTTWTASMLDLQQKKYDELVGAKETLTNPQLQMVVSRAIPMIRNHLSKLRSLHKNLVRAAIQQKKEAERARKLNKT